MNNVNLYFQGHTINLCRVDCGNYIWNTQVVTTSSSSWHPQETTYIFIRSNIFATLALMDYYIYICHLNDRNAWWDIPQVQQKVVTVPHIFKVAMLHWFPWCVHYISQFQRATGMIRIMESMTLSYKVVLLHYHNRHNVANKIPFHLSYKGSLFPQYC